MDDCRETIRPEPTIPSAIIGTMSDRYAAQLGSYRRSVPIWTAETQDGTPGASATCRLGSDGAPMACERCGNAMYRMHAVWRCPKCRFKTDCCGW